jgi:hypothetical protein
MMLTKPIGALVAAFSGATVAANGIAVKRGADEMLYGITSAP